MYRILSIAFSIKLFLFSNLLLISITFAIVNLYFCIGNSLSKGLFTMNKIKCLTGNQLKIFALIAMTLDHIGLELLPQYPFLRIIGRLAFPLFAYMIAEGCRYTKNRTRYLLCIASMGLVCQLVYFFATGSLYQCILVTFSLSICLIYSLDIAIHKPNMLRCLLALGTLLTVIFVCVYLPSILSPYSDFAIDFGIWGVLLAVFIYFAPDNLKAIATALALIPLCLTGADNQWYSLISVILLFLYNGKRGKARIKNLFYIYYPAHLVAIYLLSYII